MRAIHITRDSKEMGEVVKYYIRKLSLSPVRYGIYEKDRLILSFGSTTLKIFFPNFSKTKHIAEKNDIDELFNHDFIKKIKAYEDKVIRKEMFTYLAGQETSPVKLEKWLSQRQLTSVKIREWILFAQKNNFLSIKRYIERAVEKKKLQGYPWWQVKRKLNWELSRYRYLFFNESNGTDLEDILSLHSYDDLKILQEYYHPPLRLVNDPKKLKRYLLGKGFTRNTIKDYLDQLIKK